MFLYGSAQQPRGESDARIAGRGEKNKIAYLSVTTEMHQRKDANCGFGDKAVIDSTLLLPSAGN